MKLTIVSSSTLLKQKRWNPQFFVKGTDSSSLFSYPLVPLRELVSERHEFIQPDSYPGRTFNYIGLENIESLTGALVGFEPRKGAAIRSRSKVYCLGDVLYGRLRPTLNKAMVVDGRLTEGICSTELFVLVPREGMIAASLLRIIITSGYFVNIVSSLTGGAALPRIQLDDFLGIKVPWPPIEKQQELATFISEMEHQWSITRAESEAIPTALHDTIWECLKNGYRPKLSIHASNQQMWNNPLPREDF